MEAQERMMRRVLVRSHWRQGRPVRAHFKLSPDEKRERIMEARRLALDRCFGSSEDDVEVIRRHAEQRGADEEDLAEIEDAYRSA